MTLRQPAVHGDKCLDEATGPTQQVAVLDARPTQSLDSRDIVIGQRRDQIVRKVLIKQDAHW